MLGAVTVDGVGDQFAIFVISVILKGQQLQENLTAVIVDCVGELTEHTVILALEYILVGVNIVVLSENVHVLGGENDVGAAAFCLVGIVADDGFRGIFLYTVEHGDTGGGGPDAVFKGDTADGDGGE